MYFFVYLPNYDKIMLTTYKDVRMMIEKIVAQLLLLYPEVKGKDIKIEQLEYDEQCYEISDEVEGNQFLSLLLNNEGELDSFSVDSDYFNNDKVLSKEAILNKAKDFVEVFVKDEQEPLHLSAVIDFDEQWWIDFVRKDPYLGLELPNSGISIQVMKNGVILGASFEMGSVGIEEPEIMISAEEAKALFLEKLILTPAIIKFDTDYVDGDDVYHLVYYVEDFVMWIGTDGELETIETFGVKRSQYEMLLPVHNTPKELHDIIGIPRDFTKISDEKTSDGRLEIWSNEPDVNHECEEVNLFEIYFDEADRVSSLSCGPDEEDAELNRSAEEALERAIEFLQLQYGDVTERFCLLKEEHEMLLYDEEGENEQVYAYQFNFQRFERGIIVGGATISIEVDSRSLMITTVNAEKGLQIDLSEIAVDCTFPIEKAKEVYENALEMVYSWSKEIDEDPIIYKLTYLSDFPATSGNMRAIDAKTGQPWFIDASYMDEFES